MKDFFKLPLMFFRVCWEEGIKKAVMLAVNTIAQRCRIVRRVVSLTGKFPPKSRSNASAWLGLLKLRPTVSVIMPVFNSRWLAEAVDSVLKQSYGQFELILVDDCSTRQQTIEVLERVRRDERVRVISNSRNLGISGATNVGIEASQGEYIAFIDHDDLIHPDALALFVRTLNNGHDEDVFFTDEAVIRANSTVAGFIQKCPISLDLLLSCNAVSHFCIMKKSALLRIGLLKSEYDGAQDHDLAIRAMEHGLSFCHMPFQLYGWRAHTEATSGTIRSFDKKSDAPYPKAYLSGKKTIQAYLDRNGIRAFVTDDAFFWYRVKYALPERADEVAMIIPFRDKVAYLRRFLRSMKRTTYANVIIYLVNNQSKLPETIKYLDKLKEQKDPKLRFVDFDEPFNYSRLYNQVVAKVPNEILLFINNDMEVIQPDWLEAMLEHIYREKVAAVGCRLVRRNGAIQHASVIFRPNIYFCAMNLYHEDGYYSKVQRDVTGVTAACMMIRKSVFQQVGGFDEVQFPIGFSDADLCLKINLAGYKIIYTPFAKVRHQESASRKVHEEVYEKYALFSRYIGNTPMFDKRYKPS